MIALLSPRAEHKQGTKLVVVVHALNHHLPLQKRKVRSTSNVLTVQVCQCSNKENIEQKRETEESYDADPVPRLRGE